ncbi:MAG: family 20 glycosylhydrolase, partial [Lentisphaeria bacterium]|nr:family 20 glycosylhydrolase [Lentisphaeria bacterium]
MRKKEFLRIAQLDLARQMETVPLIKNFIDLLAQFDYNTLFLYVEWRVRTKAFDIGKEEGYSAGELKEIISYAAKKKIMIIPGFAGEEKLYKDLCPRIRRSGDRISYTLYRERFLYTCSRKRSERHSGTPGIYPYKRC